MSQEGGKHGQRKVREGNCCSGDLEKADGVGPGAWGGLASDGKKDASSSGTRPSQAAGMRGRRSPFGGWKKNEGPCDVSAFPCWRETNFVS